MQSTVGNSRTSTAGAEILTGLSDGVAIPFVVTTGLSGALDETGTIAMVGIAVVCIGAIAMAVSSYFTRKEELAEAAKKHDPVKAEEELRNLGLSKQATAIIVEEMQKEDQQWSETLARHDLEAKGVDNRSILNSAMVIGAAYVAGGALPVLPYFLLEASQQGLLCSAGLTIPALFLIGYRRARMAEVNGWTGGVRLLITSVAAAAAAYMMAQLFR